MTAAKRAKKKPINFQLDMPLGQEWDNIELLRTSILNCLAVVFQNTDFCHTVSMVGSELLENALKYGDAQRGDPGLFRVRVSGDAEKVRIEVSNPVVSGSDDVKDLLATVRWLGRIKSPHEAYAQKLREVAEAAGTSQAVSHLGLVRIAYEGNCKIRATVAEDVLSVSATCRP
jgi:hypothetical protein